MNARIVLAAIAAVCCVQGISAASFARPLPFFEDEVREVDLANVDVGEVLERLMLAVEQAANEEDTELFAVEGTKKVKGARNIFTCATSLVGVFKTLKGVKELYDQYRNDKASEKAAEAACQESPAALLAAFLAKDSDSTAECIKKAQEEGKKKIDEIKAQIPAEALKVAGAIFSLKSCFSLI